MADVDRINNVAVLLLAAVEQAAADAAVTLPTRRFLSNGEVANDCDQVAIEHREVARGTPARPTGERILLPDTWTAHYTIWIMRCVPVVDAHGNPPTVDQLNATAKILHRDGTVLTLFLLAGLRDLEATCTYVTAGPAQPFGPEGGVAGWRLDVAVGL